MWLAKCLYRNDLSWSLNHSVSVSVCVTYKMYLREWLEQITQPLCICVCMWLAKCLYRNDLSWSLNHSVSVSVCVTYKMYLREWLEQITQPLCICVCMWLTKCLYGNDWSRSLNHSVSVSVCDWQNVFTGMTGTDHSTTLYLCLYVTNKMSLREWLEQITQPLCICVCMWLAKCLYGNDWNRSLNHSVSVSVCDKKNVFTGMTREDHSTTLYLWLYVTNKMSLREWLEQITQPLCICVCMWLAKCLYGNDWNRSLNHSVSVSVWLKKCLYGND